MPSLPDKIPPYRPLQKLIDAINQLRDYVASLAPRSSLDVLTTHSRIGVSRQGNPAGAKGSTVATWFEGEWSPLRQYTAGKGVKISDGLASGFYLALTSTTMVPGLDSAGNTISVADPLTAFPWLGIQWVLLGRIVDQSNWV